jgi:hypothetical protein
MASVVKMPNRVARRSKHLFSWLKNVQNLTIHCHSHHPVASRTSLI